MRSFTYFSSDLLFFYVNLSESLNHFLRSNLVLITLFSFKSYILCPFAMKLFKMYASFAPIFKHFHVSIFLS
ncbi:hypothetical protein PIL02S_03439 [Paenibacillus illinoisensis]|uniref:Uncharacterized protein n=1 Tax=Paenibacillus illinoisensis TaxID=59845 RepID=A0A2W0CKD4_9BACL|nr:hypothetical protein PIL02S_03439 [Paenibacillus illinoisensis]